MRGKYCPIHRDTEMVVVVYCPSHGGMKTAKGMTAKQRKERARKAIQARWARYREQDQTGNFFATFPSPEPSFVQISGVSWF